MTLLKIAASTALAHRLHTERALVPLDQTNFTDIAALVISVEDARSSMLAVRRHTGFAIPAFVGVDAACRRAPTCCSSMMRRPMLRQLNWKPRRRVTNRCCCRRFLIR